jgi:alpha-amylase
MAHQRQEGGEAASIHDRVRVKEAGLDQKLFYDRDRRVSLVDHFLPPATTLDEMMRAQNQEWGDFRKASFDFKVHPPKKKGQHLRVLMSRDGRLSDHSEGVPLKLTKNLTFAPGLFHLETDYAVQNKGTRDARFLFATEWNLTLLAGDAPDRNYFIKGRTLAQPRLFSTGEEPAVTEVGMKDDWLQLQIVLKTSQPAKFWRYPVETISQSEGGFERVYQGSCLLLGWEVFLGPRDVFEAKVITRLQEAV